MNGIYPWVRLHNNPIIKPSLLSQDWESDAVYKPYPIYSNGQWKLWYNGRSGSMEQIGLATMEGFELGFDQMDLNSFVHSSDTIQEFLVQVLDGGTSSVIPIEISSLENPLVTVHNFCVQHKLKTSFCSALKEQLQNNKNFDFSFEFKDMYKHLGLSNIGALLPSLELFHQVVKSSIFPGDPSFEGFLACQYRQVYLYMLSGATEWVRNVCETGFNGGHSAFSLLFSSNTSNILSFDLMNKRFQFVAKQLFESLFGVKRLSIIPGDSMESLPRYISEHPNHSCDLIAIDGGHQFQVALSDVLNFQQMSSCDNIVMMDDVFQKYSDEWGTHHVDGARDSWLQAISSGIIKQYGCYEFYEETSDVWVDVGVWGGSSLLPRSFCIRLFVKDSSICPFNISMKSEKRILEILKEIGLPSCEVGCCN